MLGAQLTVLPARCWFTSSQASAALATSANAQAALAHASCKARNISLASTCSTHTHPSVTPLAPPPPLASTCSAMATLTAPAPPVTPTSGTCAASRWPSVDTPLTARRTSSECPRVYAQACTHCCAACALLYGYALSMFLVSLHERYRNTGCLCVQERAGASGWRGTQKKKRK